MTDDEGDRDPEKTVIRKVVPEATVVRSVDPGATHVRQVPPDQAPPASPPPGKTDLLSWLAGLPNRHPGRILAGVGVFFVIAVVLGAPVAGMLHANDPFNDHSSQSVAVNKLIGNATGERPGPQVIALVTPPGGVGAPGSRALVASVAAQLRQDPTVTRTLSYYSTGSRSFVSRDGRSTYVAAFFKNVSDNGACERRRTAVGTRAAARRRCLLGGPAVASRAARQRGRKGSRQGRGTGVPDPVHPLAVRLPWCRGGADAAVRRRYHGHDHLPGPARRQLVPRRCLSSR